MLLYAGRQEDLAMWGPLIFKRALHLVGKPPFERSFWGATVHTVGDSEEISGSTCKGEEGPAKVASEALRPGMQNPAALFRSQVEIAEIVVPLTDLRLGERWVHGATSTRTSFAPTHQSYS